MERDIEKDLLEIECAIKEHEERDNTFTVSVLQRCHELVSELKKNRDLEEQGLLLKLPCKVGDTVYMTDGNSLTVREIHIQDNLVKYFVARFNPNGLDVRFTFDRIGKNVFLTQSEAGEALKRMEEQGNVT